MNTSCDKNRNKKRIVFAKVLVIVLVALIVVSAWYLLWPKASNSPNDPNFVVWHSYPEGSPQAEYIEKTAIPAVEKQHPRLTASAVYYSDDEISDQVLRAKNEGALPDVIFLNHENMAALAQYGALADLDNEDRLSGLYGGAEPLPERNIAAGKIGDKRFGLPTEASVQVLLYNPELFSGAGLAPPSGLPELWNVLETLSSDGRVYGFVLPDAGMKSLAPFVWSDGGELVSEDGKRADGFLNHGKNIKIFDRFAAALESGRIFLADGDADALQLFAEGKAAMTVINANDISVFKEQYPDSAFETAPFPKGSAGSVTVLDCKYVCLTISADMNAAASFLEDVLSFFSVPAETLASARPLPVSYSIRDMNNEFLLAMKQISEGYMTTEEALDELARKWDAYL